MLFPLLVVGALESTESAFLYSESRGWNVASGLCLWSLVPNSLSCPAHSEGNPRISPVALGTPLCTGFFPMPNDSKPCPSPFYKFSGSKPCSEFSRKNPIINIFLSYSFQQLCIFTVVLPKKKVGLTEVK